MSEENKALVRRLFEEVLNQKRVDVIDELFARDYVDHDPDNPDQKPGSEGVHDWVNDFITAFPDVHLTIDGMIAEGDEAATRFTFRATHKGDLVGIAPTDKQVTVTGVWISRFSGGKIVEAWLNMNTLGMMQQLGVISNE